jgi:hypothetical protein
LGPLLFLLYINDLPTAVTHKAITISFADETSVSITSQNALDLQNVLNTAFQQLTKWFEVNSHSLNLRKQFFLQFSTKSPNYFDINITHENNLISKAKDIKFLVLIINDTLSWKAY